MNRFTLVLLMLISCKPVYAQSWFGDPVLRQVYGYHTTECVVDLDADTSAITTVNADSGPSETSNEHILNVAATTGIVVGDYVVIDQGGAKEEVCLVDTVNTGASLEMSECCIETAVSPYYSCSVGGDLNYDHLGADAEDVELTNRIGPLEGKRFYVLSLTSTAVAGVAGEFLQGGVAVTSDRNASLADPVVPVPLQAAMEKVVRINEQYPYISVMPQADDAIFRACKLDYEL